VGDVEGQVACILGNVRALLAKAGMDFGDVVSATTYLKRAEDYRALCRVAAAADLPAQLPMPVVVAALCRPDWLCEIELCAVQTGPNP
jgi:enamine deaminase RidA (YjgF/YER057c/UK114 family)